MYPTSAAPSKVSRGTREGMAESILRLVVFMIFVVYASDGRLRSSRVSVGVKEIDVVSTGLYYIPMIHADK